MSLQQPFIPQAQGAPTKGRPSARPGDVEMTQTQACSQGLRVLRGRETSKQTFTVPRDQSQMG